MLRRIYFAIPDTAHARRIVAELESAGISREQMHASAKDGVELSDLPVATLAQRDDLVWRLDKLFWRGNLWFFGGAVALLVAAVAITSAPLAVVAAVLMVASYLLGKRFAVRIPHTHIGEMKVPLAHGEIVLMIDAPKDRVREIVQRVSRHHPEAYVSGVGWTMPALGT